MSDLPEHVERLILGGRRRYDRREIHHRSGVSPDRTLRLWRAMGFADVADDERVFTRADLDALDQLEQLRRAGLVPAEVQVAVIRSIAVAMSGLADWQVNGLYRTNPDVSPDRPEELLQALRAVLTSLERLQSYVWRRQLVAAARRFRTVRVGDPGTRVMVVGSADLVGFTRATRRLSPAELVELVELFHGLVAEVAAEHDGRVVKTIGDGVQFVADTPEHAAGLALDLLDRAISSRLPELRIGMAMGPVLPRFGDVYGSVVHTAGRLTSEARPGRVLVDHDTAVALAGDPRFTLRMRRAVTMPGYPRLQPWGLRRAAEAGP